METSNDSIKQTNEKKQLLLSQSINGLEKETTRMDKPFVTINGTQGNKNRGREFVYSQREREFKLENYN